MNGPHGNGGGNGSGSGGDTRRRWAGKPDEGSVKLAQETAHELGNVTVALRGFVELLRARLEPGSEQAELLDRIGDCAAALGEATARLQAVAVAGRPGGPGGDG